MYTRILLPEVLPEEKYRIFFAGNVIWYLYYIQQKFYSSVSKNSYIYRVSVNGINKSKNTLVSCYSVLHVACATISQWDQDQIYDSKPSSDTAQFLIQIYLFNSRFWFHNILIRLVAMCIVTKLYNMESKSMVALFSIGIYSTPTSDNSLLNFIQNHLKIIILNIYYKIAYLLFKNLHTSFYT